MTALDLADELIVLRDLAYGIHVLAAPEYLAMTHDEVLARRDEVKRVLGGIQISQDPLRKVRITAADFKTDSQK